MNLVQLALTLMIFGAVTLIKNADIDTLYSGYGSMGTLVMELDLREEQAFHFQGANLVKMN